MAVPAVAERFTCGRPLSRTMRARAIDHVNLRIPETGVETALEFYRDVLGFEPENVDEYRLGDRGIFSFRLAESAVIHVRPVGDFEPPTDTNFDHVAIVVETTADDVRERLESADVDIVREGTPLGATGRNPAVYARDPFGYLLEFKQARGV